MRIAFVHSPEDYYEQNYGTLFVPLWAYYLASFLPEGWDTEVIDCRIVDPESCGAADVFAFSGINQDLGAIEKTRNVLKKKYPQAIFVLGGPMTWSFDQEGKLDLLDAFDYIFILDGEQALNDFLEQFARGERPVDRIIRSERFPVRDARKIRFDLLDVQAKNYYGAVIEVSRGCPFLCEFCDIRVLPGNNATNTKDIALIIEELDEYTKRGINKFQIACDNFIGDLRWAEECLDAILEWKQRTGADVSFFTWLTINLYRLTDHMRKMRECGFSILFIGIESVNKNSLLETAKVQNVKVLNEAVETIHAYGFIIAPGFIFGFDSDTEDVFDQTLEFIKNTGTIGGDPSFLTALAGTPLFERMRATGRLVEEKGEKGIERRKIETNIHYLLDKDFLARGFLYFVDSFCNQSFQYQRFMRHIGLMREKNHYVPMRSSGYASPWPYLKLQISNKNYRNMLFRRIFYLLHPVRTFAMAKAVVVGRIHSPQNMTDFFSSFFYWVYAWTNMAMKYEGLTLEDFRLQSVSDDFDRSKLIAAPDKQKEVELEQIHGTKVSNQRRFTDRALLDLMDSTDA